MLKRLIKAVLGWDSRPKREKEVFMHRSQRVLARSISLFPLPLPFLLRLFGSDKHIPEVHSYGHTYGRLFRKWKFHSVKLLEIGIGGYRGHVGGQSLLAWQAYFPFGHIVAADIEPKQELTGGRATVHVVDQSSEPALAALCRQEGPFDIIIDDGSHMNAHQIFTFEKTWDSLSDGGVYIIEDVQTSFWPGKVVGVTWDGARAGEPAFDRTCYGYFLELAKYINHAEFVEPINLNQALLSTARKTKRISFEHNMIVIEKGDNVEVSYALSLGDV